MTPAQAIERGFALVNWLAQELNSLPFLSSPRSQLSAACLSIAQDHHAGVIVLLERDLHAPAMALVRPQYEAYVRGVWLANCASAAEVRRFAKNGNAPPIAVQLASLELVEAFSNGQLSRIKAESWSAMCSFTHTGILQVERLLTETRIEQNFPPEELVQAANFTGAIALMSGIGMAALAEDGMLGTTLLEKARQYARHET